MDHIYLSPDDLYEAGSAFRQAGKDCQAINTQLDAVISELEKHWDGASKQSFYKNYQEWRSYLQGLSVMFNNVSEELEALGERFAQEDKRR